MKCNRKRTDDSIGNVKLIQQVDDIQEKMNGLTRTTNPHGRIFRASPSR